MHEKPTRKYAPRQPRVERKCEICDEPFMARQCELRIGKDRFCSPACSHEARRRERAEGIIRGNFKGGRTHTSGRYVDLLVAPYTYRPEHRVVVEQHLGRPLVPGEEIHHRNGIVTDNRIENLMVTNHREHMQIHKGIGDKWAREYDQCVLCHRSDSKHVGKGICARCTAQKRYVPHPRPEGWSRLPKDFGWSRHHEHCISCGTSTIRHWAKGLCKTCYHQRNRE